MLFRAPGTAPQGPLACGQHSGGLAILTAGRVFRSDADMVGTPPGDDCFSFYGKAMQWSNWTPHLTEFLTKIHNSTKNCSGVVVGAFWVVITKRANVLQPRTDPTCASIIAWCIAPALTNAGLFVKLVQGLTEFGSYPAHIGLEIPVRPAAGCFCHRHPFWLSPMMTIGAASGPLRFLEILCLLHFFCLNRSIHLLLLCILRLMTQMQNSL